MRSFEVGPEPSGRWTKYGLWSDSDDVLAGRFNAEAYDAKYAGRLLAYGLERLDGRTLRLALPTWAVEATLARSAVLIADVEVYDQEDPDAGPAPAMTQEDAVSWFGQLGGVEPVPDVDRFEGPDWLMDLIDWVETLRVERVRRSYWSWHFRGRQVLRLRISTSRVKGIAGVNYSKPIGDQPKRVEFDLPLEDVPNEEKLEKIRAAVTKAVERRRLGHDKGHREHLLQGALATDPGLLGMVELHREVPAWRPTATTAGRGFIDFIGVDIDDRLHAVETKIGPDAMLGLQALDYWAWTTHHRAELAASLDMADSGDDVQLDVVLGEPAKGSLIHPAAAATLDLIDTDVVDWRAHVVRDWNTVARPARLLRPRTVRRIPEHTVPGPEVLTHD